MVTDPVCGMTIEIKNAVAQELHQGSSVYFCSNNCHSEFLANPEQYLSTYKLTDPVCGMEVSKNSSYYLEYAEQNYYFCSESCLGQFKTEPTQYLS